MRAASAQVRSFFLFCLSFISSAAVCGELLETTTSARWRLGGLAKWLTALEHWRPETRRCFRLGTMESAAGLGCWSLWCGSLLVRGWGRLQWLSTHQSESRLAVVLLQDEPLRNATTRSKVKPSAGMQQNTVQPSACRSHMCTDLHRPAGH